MTMLLEGSTRKRLAVLSGLISEPVGLRLAELAADVPEDRAIVEVGSYRGRSACYLAAGAQAGCGAHVFAIDAWNLPGNPAGKHSFDTARRAFDRQVEFAGLREQITPVTGFSVDVAKAWTGAVGLLFIDGSHVYEDVRADLVAWRPHLHENAIVAFDDYKTPRNPGVTRFVDELIAAGNRPDLDTPPLAIIQRQPEEGRPQ